jgi:shikimate kinase
MPGVGKSYWGSKLAVYYNLPYIDLDDYIEQTAGMTLADIFTEQGETDFRNLERHTLLEIVSSQPYNTIVSCGGGTPAFLSNLDDMKMAGCAVYLQADIDILLQRLQSSLTKRPLLEAANDYRAAVCELFNTRRAFYEQANYIFEVENLSVANFAQIIDSCTGRR